jgi:hypothetical protein
MREHVVKNNSIVLDSAFQKGTYQIRGSHEGTMSIGTGRNTHLAVNNQYIATFSPMRTSTGGTYLHDGNLHEFPKLAMGYADTSKPNTYAAGLVPEGAAHNDVDPHLFLGKNGLWGLPSEHTGAVYDSFLALDDTPNNSTHAAGMYVKMGNANKLEFTDLAADVAALDLDSLTTRSLSVTSDIRSKKHIESYNPDTAVGIVNKLDMVKFKYREGDVRDKLGVIAQNVEAHFPQAVTQGAQYKQVDYTQIIGLLMANVKALNVRVEKLQTQLDGSN